MKDSLKHYVRVVAVTAAVEVKGATMPYTSLNGHMFSFLTKDGTLALRLPQEDRVAFLKKYKTKLCEQHGTVMKEYVEVPASLLAKTAELKLYFKISHAYVGELKPKATTKGKKKVAKGVGKKVAKKKKSR